MSQPLVSIGCRFITSSATCLTRWTRSWRRTTETSRSSSQTMPQLTTQHEICVDYASRHDGIRYHRVAQNRGAVYNFNEAFRLSNGCYFTWASGHDTRDPSALRKCVAELEERPDVVLCYPMTWLVEADGTSAEMSDTLKTLGLSRPNRLKATILDLIWCNAIYGVTPAPQRSGKLGCHGMYSGQRSCLARRTQPSRGLSPGRRASAVSATEPSLRGRGGESFEDCFHARHWGYTEC